MGRRGLARNGDGRVVKKKTLLQQIEKIQNDRTYLRSAIASLIAVARDAPGAIKPAVVDELQKALDRTADDE